MEVFGWIGMVIVSLQFIPQLIKSIQTKRVEDLSLLMIIFISTGAFMWLLHGFFVNDMPILFTNIVVLSISLAMLFVKLKYKK